MNHSFVVVGIFLKKKNKKNQKKHAENFRVLSVLKYGI